MLFCMLYNTFNATSVEIANFTEIIKKYQKKFDIHF